MKQGQASVKSDRNVVGIANFPVFDSLDEAKSQLGEEKCLDLINSQTKTNAMNDVRSQFAGEPSKKWLRDQATQELINDSDACRRFAGDVEGMRAEIEKRMEVIAARMKQQKAEQAKALAAESNDEDDE